MRSILIFVLISTTCFYGVTSPPTTIAITTKSIIGANSTTDVTSAIWRFFGSSTSKFLSTTTATIVTTAKGSPGMPWWAITIITICVLVLVIAAVGVLIYATKTRLWSKKPVDVEMPTKKDQSISVSTSQKPQQLRTNKISSQRLARKSLSSSPHRALSAGSSAARVKLISSAMAKGRPMTSNKLASTACGKLIAGCMPSPELNLKYSASGRLLASIPEPISPGSQLVMSSRLNLQALQPPEPSSSHLVEPKSEKKKSKLSFFFSKKSPSKSSKSNDNNKNKTTKKSGTGFFGRKKKSRKKDSGSESSDGSKSRSGTKSKSSGSASAGDHEPAQKKQAPPQQAQPPLLPSATISVSTASISKTGSRSTVTASISKTGSGSTVTNSSTASGKSQHNDQPIPKPLPQGKLADSDQFKYSVKKKY